MRINGTLFILLFITDIIGLTTILFVHNTNRGTVVPVEMNETIVVDSIPSFTNLSPSDGLKMALEYYGVKYPDIVYAQAILETGYFTSQQYVKYNNLFGLYNSNKKQYYRFNHWSESVEAYINMVEYKYKDGTDYYHFLKTLPYAEDPQYINKIKQIINKQNDIQRVSR